MMMAQSLYTFDEINQLIPHEGEMCLWDSVLAFDEFSLRCRTARHLAKTHPLKTNGCLSKLHLIEFGAQSIAIHGGLLSQQGLKLPRPGYLASVKNIHFGTFNDQTPHIYCHSSQIMSDNQSKLYQFELTDNEQRLICAGRALVIHPERQED